MELELRIAQRVDELKKERERYTIEANQTLVALNTAIAELERLLQPEQGDSNA